MALPSDPIPAPGFTLISGKRAPPDRTAKYEVQFSSGYVDRKHQYTADQLNWIHDGGPWDIVAVRRVE